MGGGEARVRKSLGRLNETRWGQECAKRYCELRQYVRNIADNKGESCEVRQECWTNNVVNLRVSQISTCAQTRDGYQPWERDRLQLNAPALAERLRWSIRQFLREAPYLSQLMRLATCVWKIMHRT